MDLGLSGKVAFITGGSAGIGLAIARALTREGASVALCARDAARLAAAAAELPRAHTEVADVTDPDALAAAIDNSAAALGRLDLLVANAGGASGGGLLDSTPDDWAATFAINVLHAAHAIRTAVPHFDRAGGGAALVIASITGRKPGPKSSYAAAKAAEIHLAATLGQELGPRGIRVNSLSPGSVLFEGGGWDWLRTNRPEDYERFAHDDFPARRLLTLDEVADTACFLLSERAGGINGTDIAVDGAQDHPSAGRFF